jgi:hypothetical protein
MKPYLLRAASHACNRMKAYFLQNEEMTASRRNVAHSGYSSGVAANLAGGNFLTGFLLLLNADDAFIGLVTVVAMAGNVLQVLSPMLLERFPNRKKLLIYTRISIHSIDIVLIGLIPYLLSADSTKLFLVIAFKLLVSILNAVAAPGFAIWHIKCIPQEIRTKYYSVFTVVNTILIYVIVIIASTVADSFKASGNALTGLTILRGLALIFAAADILFLLRIKEYPNEQDSNRPRLMDVLVSPFRQKKYLKSVMIACLWSFSANLPGPYFSIYLLRDLGVSYSFLTIVNMLYIPLLVFLTPVWAKRIRNTSWFRVLVQSMTFYLISYIGLSFVTSGTLFLYPLFMILAFAFSPGINLAFCNIPYINIPQKNQTRYIGFYSAMNNFVALIAVVISRQFILISAEYKINILGIEMQNKQYIYLITAFVMLLATAAIAVIRKSAERE